MAGRQALGGRLRRRPVRGPHQLERQHLPRAVLLRRQDDRAPPRLSEEKPEDTEGRLGPRAAADERHRLAVKKKHIGSTLDSLLDELEEREDVELLTQKKLLAAKIERAMLKRNMSQAELARTMRTSRTVIHRLLDPRDTSVTLATLSKASKALGVKLLKVA